jgi:hypothetical protein
MRSTALKAHDAAFSAEWLFLVVSGDCCSPWASTRTLSAAQGNGPAHGETARQHDKHHDDEPPQARTASNACVNTHSAHAPQAPPIAARRAQRAEGERSQQDYWFSLDYLLILSIRDHLKSKGSSRDPASLGGRTYRKRSVAAKCETSSTDPVRREAQKRMNARSGSRKDTFFIAIATLVCRP